MHQPNQVKIDFTLSVITGAFIQIGKEVTNDLIAFLAPYRDSDCFMSNGALFYGKLNLF